MLTTLRFDGDTLSLDCDQTPMYESRPIRADDTQRWVRLSKRYEHLRQQAARADTAAELLDLGRELYAWLNGEQDWLVRIRPPAPRDAWVMEFAAALPLTAPASAFLSLPWELLADDRGHWAGDFTLRYCPVRRLGGRDEPVAPSTEQLTLIFMAAAPRGETVLDYEAEEAAILNATGAGGGQPAVDLIVEESGTLALLGECVAREAPDVLHLSCHGQSEPEPLLMLESDEGAVCPVSAEQLSLELLGLRPKLLFLSACHSAQGSAVVDSLAGRLLGTGFPAVLGWEGAVRDRDATAFAAALYRALARKVALAEAVSAARLALLTDPAATSEGLADARQHRARDWHLARLFLSPHGGGPLTCGDKSRRRLRPDAGQQAFLDEKGQTVPVAGRDEFVGRRRQIQAILRAFRMSTTAGVVIHGLGRQGKSSLTARIANRLPQHATVVVYEHYTAAAILDAFRRVVGGAAVSAIVDRDPGRRNEPAEFAIRLRELLEGPCYDNAPPSRPVLLVLDDLERILDTPETGLPRVQPNYQPVLRALLETFAHATTHSHLLVTSRYRFTLPDQRGRDLADVLTWVHLPPMDTTEARKQAYHACPAECPPGCRPDGGLHCYRPG